MGDTDFDKEDIVPFRAFSQPHGMRLTWFAVFLSLYDEDYVDTVEYAQRPTDYPTGNTSSQVFHDLCSGYQFVPGH